MTYAAKQKVVAYIYGATVRIDMNQLGVNNSL